MARVGRPQLEWSTNTQLLADMVYVTGDKLYGWCKAGISNAISDPTVGLPAALTRSFYTVFTRRPITARHPMHYGESFTSFSPKTKRFAGTKMGPYAEGWRFAGYEQSGFAFTRKYSWSHIALNFLNRGHHLAPVMNATFKGWNTTQKARNGMEDMIEAGIVKLYKQEVRDKPLEKIEAGVLTLA